jgi:hypothetical protein
MNLPCTFPPATINASNALSARKSPALLPGTALKAKSPYLDLQQLPAHSIVKPSLRKSLGGQASRGRTPFDALKSPGEPAGSGPPQSFY